MYWGEAMVEITEEEIVDEAISLNALSGIEVPNTIKLRGESKKNQMTLLLDSGRTHIFLNLETTKKIRCVINEDAPIRVTIANGNHLMSLYIFHRFKWRIQGAEFEELVRLIRLGEMI